MKSASGSVLYDVPGPRARARNMVLNVIGAVLIAAAGWYVYDKFAQDPKGPQTSQWDPEKWKPFLEGDTWDNFLLPGIEGTLKAAALAAVLAMAFGTLCAVGRMSTIRPVAWIAAAVIEFFRAVPLLIMMIFLWLAPTKLFGADANVFLAVVLALMFYNGAVIAEVIRAGVQALPRGQREAGAAIGLTNAQVMRLILLPQALRAMLPAIVAQLVVLLKDSALGYIIGYAELLRQGNNIATNNGNLVPALLVIAAIFIVMNLALTGLANWIERRTRRRGRTAATVGHADVVPPAAGTGAAL
ncbi:amino acid ABC transporter permease [Nocardioides caeni]|uniref:Amino acid ABC transporter permease n=1 Tax=Nocardioides caeni TaxID=574700 RepID=A0A4S8NEF3_9ACTN|nr:amino acid ABC transporter permease [Nocardioides caeni]THV14665.1 amino acid ABC transporter permease [Nocardioides caeni]